MAERPRLLHGEFTITRVYDAPRELVWQMWPDHEHIARWWGPAGMTTPIESIEVDLRPGGAFRAVMVHDRHGGRFPSDMVVREVVEPELLVLEWEEQRHIGPGSLAVTFTDLGERTRASDLRHLRRGLAAAPQRQPLHRAHQRDAQARGLAHAAGADVERHRPRGRCRGGRGEAQGV